MHHVEAWHDPAWLRSRHQRLVDRGLLDPDEPTVYSHQAHVEEMRAEFTPTERQMIRFHVASTEQEEG